MGNNIDIFLITGVSFSIPLMFEFFHIFHIRYGISKFKIRKFIHVISGMFVFIIPFFSNSLSPVIVSGIILTFLLILNNKISFFHKYFQLLAEEEEIKVGYLQGPIAFAIAFLIMTIMNYFFPGNIEILVSSILIMVIGDTLAAIVGKKWGKKNIVIFGRKWRRTFLGSLTMFISSVIVITVVYWYFAKLNFFSIVLLATIGTIIEFFSPSKWDDLLIPVVSCFVFFVINYFQVIFVGIPLAFLFYSPL